ncbi:MAG: magnesium transporter CorA family protein [Candidatus Woesearchaeota archaeon]
MLNYYKRTKVDENIITLDKCETGAWISLINPNEEEINFVSELQNVDKDFLKSATDPDEKPRVEIDNGNVLIIIKIPYKDENLIYTLSFGIVVSEKNIITICTSDNIVIQDFLNLKVKNFYTTKKTRFCLQILARANRNYQKFLDEIEREIEKTESSITKSFKNEEIIKLLGIQKSLVYINTAVLSNEKVLERILGGKLLKMYSEDEDLLQDIIDDNKQAIDMVNIYSNILSSTMDAYASLISNNLNIVMKFLTSVTIILAIPSIVTSFYGMNVDLPFQQYHLAYVYVIFISSFLAVIASYFFFKKGYF